MKNKIFLLVVVFIKSITVSAQSQHGELQKISYARLNLPVLALKTNLLYGALAFAPNLAIEIGLSEKTSLDLSFAINLWDEKKEEDKKMKHWFAKPEFRYWLCERYNGHFFGIHPFGGAYNVNAHKIPPLFDKKYRYEGYMIGIGVSCGYHWMWNHRWSMEFSLGIGYAYLDYSKFNCTICSPKIKDETKHYFGPTKMGISLIYIMK